ncbi:hypothetical protein TRFO_14105 [Tritrichomonas foetus]|uniref:RRM domain-containing protein n=1 Tax=Tritrichomonas foetus TaxID=1144522 RepID=A0A1J4KWV7_9EUKA|nr:hypothetical protein TRFO_14105 [Tritrichomonas foetus]|eukprot:OHT15360.1 hypothetical protein TRFO_14105 [Tritrichomonas foetus]
MTTFTAFIRNIPYTFTNDELKDTLEKAFGTVTSARIVTRLNRFKQIRQSAGYGFADFAEQKSLDDAVAAHGFQAGGRNLKITVARPRVVVEDNIFVSGIAAGINEEGLKAHFATYHPVDAKIVYNYESEQRRGFGFVRVASKEDRDAAITSLEGSTLGDQTISVRVARRPFLSTEEVERRRELRRNRRRRGGRRAPRRAPQNSAPQ